MTAEHPDPYDLMDLERDLAENQDTAELGVRLCLAGGKVFVRGLVSSEQQRERVLHRVREGCPQLEAVDELGCADTGLAQAPGPAEELR